MGHNKCGTRSFHKLLRSNGYSSIHYDKGRLARRIQANFTFSRPLLDGIDEYIGYTDMELCGEFYAYRLFPLLDLQYPGSCFVYNTRDVNRWVESRLHHRKGKYARTYLERMQQAFDDHSLTLDDLKRHWVDAWMRHDADLQRYFSGRTNFCRFDITVPDDQAALCRFLRRHGYRVKGNVLPHAGARRPALADS
ncbi:sulfotransferase [Parasynechococcus sp.]|uniref:sulfotransferase n=1 Tax=Parasynechococcus sp. TaxID=3101203 RepID=UPI003703DD5E